MKKIFNLVIGLSVAFFFISSCGGDTTKNEGSQTSTHSHDGYDHEGHDHGDEHSHDDGHDHGDEHDHDHGDGHDHDGHDHDHGDGHDHDHGDASFPVSLDNGKKWAANPETTEGIIKMQDLMKRLGSDYDQAKLNELGKSLSEEYKTIFEKCTMEGEAHDQLHNYLIPMNVAIQNIETGDIELAKAKYVLVMQHLAQYNMYFE